jgi:hypothetical protein
MLLRGEILTAVKKSVFMGITCSNAILQQLKLQLESQCCVSSSIAGEASQGASEENRDTAIIINASSFFISLYPW